jgi:hypothetical protein
MDQAIRPVCCLSADVGFVSFDHHAGAAIFGPPKPCVSAMAARIRWLMNQTLFSVALIAQ